jgi:ubiquinone/menaquinone biosynthesis C-methylase UbiE
MKSLAASPDISHRFDHQMLVDTHFDLNVAGWSDVYDQNSVHGAIYRKRLEIVLSWIDELAIPGGEKVLEIGCGSGRCTVALAQRGYLVHAMDSVAGMVDATHERVAQARVRSSVSIALGDAHNLAFPDGKFGLVMAIGVMPYLHSPQNALSEMARVLKPGGFLLVTAGNRWRLKRMLDPWFSPPVQPARKAVKAILRRFRKPQSGQPGLPARFDSLREIEDWLESVGLSKIKVRTVGFPPLTFRGRPILGERASIRLNHWLQRLADGNVLGVRSSGMDYIVLARKV